MRDPFRPTAPRGVHAQIGGFSLTNACGRTYLRIQLVERVLSITQQQRPYCWVIDIPDIAVAPRHSEILYKNLYSKIL